MYDPTLAKVDACIAHGDRAGALLALRVAVVDGAMGPRDAIELMLAVRQCSCEGVRDAIVAIRSGMPGTYRFIPSAEHAFA